MNQCMGCQADWPIRPSRFYPYTNVHEVVGGYPGETVACTKEKYERWKPIGIREQERT